MFSLPAGSTQAQNAKFKIAFVPGTVDPFYQTMQRGIEQAASDLGVELVTQVPQKWDSAIQIPLINALATDKSISAVIAVPVDKNELLAPLQALNEAGLPMITVDQHVGDGDYTNGPVTFPLSYISSDNEQGGHIACDALATAIGKKGKVYIRNVKIGISATDGREKGCKDALAVYPDIMLVGVDYNDDDVNKSQAQTAAVLQRKGDVAGIFGTNVFSAEGAGAAVVNAGMKGSVQVVAFDATRDTIEKLYDGIFTIAIAQKPYDMGFLATFYAVANMRGVTSILKRITTGFVVIDINNVGEPDIARFVYR